MIEPHREREGHSIVCVFVGLCCGCVGVCVCACVACECVCVWVERRVGLLVWGYWRGVGRVRVLHRCRCGVCVRLGAGCLGVVAGRGRERICAGV